MLPNLIHFRLLLRPVGVQRKTKRAPPCAQNHRRLGLGQYSAKIVTVHVESSVYVLKIN